VIDDPKNATVQSACRILDKVGLKPRSVLLHIAAMRIVPHEDREISLSIVVERWFTRTRKYYDKSIKQLTV